MNPAPGNISVSARRICWRSLVAALLLVLLPQISPAQPVPGAESPAFKSALALWLEDDEATALPELSRLAQEGNIAARLLVGLIDKDTSLQGPWMALRSKSERIALLRTKGGLSGINWLRKVEGQDYASTLLNILDSNADIEIALSFADMGELKAQRLGLISLEARQITGFAAYADDPRFPPELRYLIWRDWLRSGSNRARLAAEIAAAHPGDPQLGLVGNKPPDFLLRDWFAVTPLAPPLRALCTASCPESAGICMQAGFESLGGYRRLATRGTPMAALISEERFAASPRGQRAILRRALSFAFLTEARLAPIRQTDACFADLLEDEGQKF